MINPIKSPIEFGRLRTFGQPMSPGVVALMNASPRQARDTFERIGSSKLGWDGSFSVCQGRWTISASERGVKQ